MCLQNSNEVKRLDIKICGLTNLEDAQAAQEAGADFLGFVLAASSVRFIKPAMLEKIANRLGSDIPLVGVFANASATAVEQIAANCNLSVVQLHGDEKWLDYADIKMPIWRAFRLLDHKPVPDLSPWLVERFVIDSAKGSSYGGTGEIADWETAASIAKERALILAGGLNPENVASAIAQVMPGGVDVSSGVESFCGKKDWQKMREFVKAVREAEAAPSRSELGSCVQSSMR